MADHQFKALTSDPEDRTTWLDRWRSCGREPFAHPDYVALFAGSAGRAVLLALEDDAGVAIMPLILRDVASETWATGVHALDATSPYGYGGPFSSGPRSYTSFWKLVHQWMHEEGMASLFGRLSLEVPVAETLPPGMSVRTTADNVVVDVRRPGPDQWRHYEHKVRKNVNKARRAGLSVAVLPTFTSAAEFTALYLTTMERRGANRGYFFDERFFERLADELPDSILVAETRDQSGKLVSAELVLRSERYAYSFLGGTAAEAFPHAPNDLLKHEVIETSRDLGLVGYVLGGGYAPNDGIFKYKRGFDPTGVKPFHRLEASVPSRSQELLQLRLDSEPRAHPSARLDAAFFPLYRAPLIIGSTIEQDNQS